MKISELADRTGVPATTLRFYESAGLLPAERTAAGYRMYGEEAVERLAFIGSAKHVGLPLEEIAELLGTWEDGACAEVKADLRPRLAARLSEAERRAAEHAAFTATLRSALSHLDALPDRDEPCGPECEFLTVAPPEPSSAAPIACTLSSDDVQHRAEQWRSVLHGATRTTIPDGLRLTVPSDRAAAIADLAVAEQHCCAFFDFRLHLDGADLHLEVRAPADAAAFLSDLFV